MKFTGVFYKTIIFMRNSSIVFSTTRFAQSRFVDIKNECRMFNVEASYYTLHTNCPQELKDFVPQQVLIKLYYSLVYPYLLYGNTVWGGTFDQHLEPLKLIQKKILRIITGSEYLAHANPLFYQTNILKVSDLHKYLLAQYMFKFKRANLIYLTSNTSTILDTVLTHRQPLTD